MRAGTENEESLWTNSRMAQKHEGVACQLAAHNSREVGSRKSGHGGGPGGLGDQDPEESVAKAPTNSHVDHRRTRWVTEEAGWEEWKDDRIF